MSKHFRILINTTLALILTTAVVLTLWISAVENQTSVQVTSVPIDLNSIQSIYIIDDSPCATGFKPKNQEAVLSQVIPWLKSAMPYTWKIPQSDNSVMACRANCLPSELHIVTLSKQNIVIYPEWYSRKDARVSIVHYIQDVIAIKNGDQINFFVSPQLHNWLRRDDWRPEFMQ